MSLVDISLDENLAKAPKNATGAENDAGKNVSVVEDVENNDETKLEDIRCFVCDVKVHGRSYSLATCKTQGSRSRIIDKLGELVGERYVVVISEDDVICRSCASLVNTFDRLQSDVKGVKVSVLRFLERKYGLAEGELLGTIDTPSPGQPPQITKSISRKFNRHSREKFVEEDKETNCSDTKRKKKSANWMQCDKCRYTTLCNNFLLHHTRHRANEKFRCEKCGVQARESSVHHCRGGERDKNHVEAGNPEDEPQAIQTAPLETVDLEGTCDELDEDTQFSPVAAGPDREPPLAATRDEQVQLIGLANPSNLHFTNFLGTDASTRDGQPFMRVLQQLGVGDDLGPSTFLTTLNNGPTGQTKENTTKQMLTLAEDGSLEMIAIDCWSNENQFERNPDMTL